MVHVHVPVLSKRRACRQGCVSHYILVKLHSLMWKRELNETRVLANMFYVQPVCMMIRVQLRTC